VYDSRHVLYEPEIACLENINIRLRVQGEKWTRESISSHLEFIVGIIHRVSHSFIQGESDIRVTKSTHFLVG